MLGSVPWRLWRNFGCYKGSAVRHAKENPAPYTADEIVIVVDDCETENKQKDRLLLWSDEIVSMAIK